MFPLLAMTRLQSQQGVVLRQKFLVRPGLRAGALYSDFTAQYTSLPSTDFSNTDNHFQSLQADCEEGRVGGKMRILTKDLLTITPADNNNNGPEEKW